MAAMIQYRVGDATAPVSDGNKIICHICNDVGGWGKGFVLAISKRWPEPEAAYREWHRNPEHNDFELGSVQLVQVHPDLWIANMIGQHGLKRQGGRPPIRYEAVTACLENLTSLAKERNATVHMPRIGCGLAGGDWEEIGPIIERTLCASDIEVYVYDREENMNTERRDRLAREILAATTTLERDSESVRAVMAAEDNRFTRALAALQKLAEAEGIPIAIAGGLGAIRYGYPAVTQDIDVAVGREHLEAFVRAAPRYGFKVTWEAKSGWHTLTFGEIEINVVPEGGKARNTAPTTIPGPVQLGVSQGLAYASLAGWMELKLSSARQKDRAHIVEVLKKTPPQTIQEVRQYIAQVHQDYLTLFDQLHQQAREEQDQEGGRSVRPNE